MISRRPLCRNPRPLGRNPSIGRVKDRTSVLRPLGVFLCQAAFRDQAPTTRVASPRRIRQSPERGRLPANRERSSRRALLPLQAINAINLEKLQEDNETALPYARRDMTSERLGIGGGTSRSHCARSTFTSTAHIGPSPAAIPSRVPTEIRASSHLPARSKNSTETDIFWFIVLVDPDLRTIARETYDEPGAHSVPRRRLFGIRREPR